MNIKNIQSKNGNLYIGNVRIYGYIYRIKNKINNKIYIGQSTRLFIVRYPGYNLSVYGSNLHIRNTVKKYKQENFCIEIIDVAFTKEELDIKEDTYIQHIYLSNVDSNGYNKKTGGSYGKHSEESKRKMSVSQKLRYKDESNKIYGRSPSEDTRLKISAALKKWYATNDNPNIIRIKAKCTYCGNTTFKKPFQLKNKKCIFCSKECYSNWLKYVNVGNNHILFNSEKVKCSYCNKEVYRQPNIINTRENIFCDRKCLGLWKSKYNIGENNPMYKRIGVYNPNIKSVVQLDRINYKIINIFHSVKNASEELSLSRSGITNTCRGKYTYCGDYIFLFKTDYVYLKNNNISFDNWRTYVYNKYYNKETPTNNISIVHLDNDYSKKLEYNSITEASLMLSLDGSAISRVCRGKQLATKGHIFLYKEDYDYLILNNKPIKEWIDYIKLKYDSNK